MSNDNDELIGREYEREYTRPGDAQEKIERVVTVDEQRDALLKAFLVGPARALDLFRRVPIRMRIRSWPDDHDACSVVIAIIGACKIGAPGQRFRLPPSLVKAPDWFALAAQGGGSLVAERVVDAFDLRDLMAPV